MERERFKILDSWRGVCALLVALHHFHVESHLYYTWFLQDAWLWVDFFFVLSGFVISYAYADRLGTWSDAGRFVIRRFGRLWPLHAAMLAWLVALELLKLLMATHGFNIDRPPFGREQVAPIAILTNLLLIQSLGVHSDLTWNVQSWSISTEFYTYIAFALVFVLARGTMARVVLPLLLAVGGGLIVALVPSDGMYTTYQYGIFRCFYGFFIGHLVCLVWRSGTVRKLFETNALAGPAAEIGALALALWFVDAVQAAGPWNLLAFAAPFVFGLLVLVYAHESGPVSRLLAVRPIALLGAWSYSIYMVHMPIVLLLDRALKLFQKATHLPVLIMRSVPWERSPVQLIAIGDRWTMDALTIVYAFVVIAVAAMTYRLIEQPGRTFFNRLAVRRAPIPGSAWNAEPHRPVAPAE